MLLDDFVCNVKILTVLKITWKDIDADAVPRPFHAFSFREKGDASYRIGENEWYVRDGDILFVPEDCGYHMKTGVETLYVIHFELGEKKQNYMEVFHVEDYVKVKRLFEKCYEIWNKKGPGYYFKAQSLFYQILEQMTVSTLGAIMDEAYFKIKPAVDYLHAHYTERECSVTTLCNLVHMSDTWLRKNFLKCYGMTPAKYANQLRISHAKELIESGYYKIERVAEMVGFEEPKYFSTVFKKYTGQSPADYKKQFVS